MSKVLVIGCGDVASVAISKCCQVSDVFTELCIASRTKSKCDALAVTLDAVTEKFGDILPKMQWVNFGGGHHITRPGYDIETLTQCIARAQNGGASRCIWSRARRVR